MLSTVVSSWAFLMLYGMKDVSLTPLGMLPSLQERMSKWSKSRFLVSNTPITCTPTAGSPWKGMLVDCIIWLSSRCSVMTSIVKSPEAISPSRRLTSVYILNNDSLKSGSFSSAELSAMRFKSLMTHEVICPARVASAAPLAVSSNSSESPSSMHKVALSGK